MSLQVEVCAVVSGLHLTAGVRAQALVVVQQAHSQPPPPPRTVTVSAVDGFSQQPTQPFDFSGVKVTHSAEAVLGSLLFRSQ